MTARQATVSGYSRPPLPAPEYRVDYIDTPLGALVCSVTSAMGHRMHAKHHPRFQGWLRSQLSTSNTQQQAS